MSPNIDARIVNELDAAHERARVAYMRRDVAGYVAVFSSALIYYQIDGRELRRRRGTRATSDLRDACVRDFASRLDCYTARTLYMGKSGQGLADRDGSRPRGARTIRPNLAGVQVLKEFTGHMSSVC